MPRRPPPVWRKGERPPNSGRVRGTPNRITVEARTLASQLVTDVDYQFKLRQDFKSRRVHPTIEALIWSYHLGRPVTQVAVQGALAVDLNARLEEERRIFAALDIADLEVLAAESQRLVDRAVELSRARTAGALRPSDALEPHTPRKPT